jgi:hypothetical protein
MTTTKYSGAYSSLNGVSGNVFNYRQYFDLGTTVTQAALDAGPLTVDLTAASGYSEYLFLFTHDLDYVSGTYLETGYTQQDFASGFNGTATRIAATSTTNNVYNQSWNNGGTNYFACCLIPYNNRSFSSITFSSVNSTTPSSVSASVGNVVIVAILGQDTTPQTFTAPSGYTLITSFGAGGSGDGSCMGVAYKVITATGTESPGAWGGASGTAADTQGCYTILLV